MMRAIDTLVAMARQSEPDAELHAFEKAGAWWFERPMPDAVRAAGMASGSFRYFTTDQTPHNRADEGFIDDVAKIALSYPKAS